jgi:hypothetical protein
MNAYFRISGTVFGLVAIAHASRLLRSWPAEVAGWAVPMWISLVAVLVAGGLAGWAFRAAGQLQK